MAIHEYVEPLGPRILVRKDEARMKTKGGIVLPDRLKSPRSPAASWKSARKFRMRRTFPSGSMTRCSSTRRMRSRSTSRRTTSCTSFPLKMSWPVFRRGPARTKRERPGIGEDITETDDSAE